MATDARREQTTAVSHRAYAGLVSRLAALTIDVALLTGVVLAVRVLPTAAWSEVLNRPEPTWLRSGATLVAALVPWLYFTTGWWLANQTVGDMTLGLVVLRRDGGDLSLPHAAIRAAAGLLLAPLWIVGLLPILWDDERRAWHDKVMRTVVRYAPHGRLAPSDTARTS
jgi:uncharacterized RDD family membrane protein YckC